MSLFTDDCVVLAKQNVKTSQIFSLRYSYLENIAVFNSFEDIGFK